MYQQVIEAVAVFASHGNSGGSAPWEINLVQKLCDWTTKNTEAFVFENGGFVGNLGLSKKLWKKYIEASYKYRTNTDKMTASDYTHLFGYLNPYYRSAYNVSKRRK